jgi:hypothetical protein
MCSGSNTTQSNWASSPSGGAAAYQKATLVGSGFAVPANAKSDINKAVRTLTGFAIRAAARQILLPAIRVPYLIAESLLVG